MRTERSLMEKELMAAADRERIRRIFGAAEGENATRTTPAAGRRVQPAGRANPHPRGYEAGGAEVRGEADASRSSTRRGAFPEGDRRELDLALASSGFCSWRESRAGGESRPHGR